MSRYKYYLRSAPVNVDLGTSSGLVKGFVEKIQCGKLSLDEPYLKNPAILTAALALHSDPCSRVWQDLLTLRCAIELSDRYAVPSPNSLIGIIKQIESQSKLLLDIRHGKTIFWDYDGTLRRRVKAGTLGGSKPEVDSDYIEEVVEHEQRPRVSELITRFKKLGFVNLITTSNLKECVISELKEEAKEYDEVGTCDYNIGNNYENPSRIFRSAGGLDGLFSEENIFGREQLGLQKDYGQVISKIWCNDPDNDDVKESMRKNCLVIGDSPGDVDRESSMVFLNVGKYQNIFRQDASTIGIIIEELLLAGEGDFARGFDRLHSRSADHDIGRVRFSMERQQYDGYVGSRVEREIHSFDSYSQGLERFPMEQIIFSRILGYSAPQ